jgi:hypothetical protein
MRKYQLASILIVLISTLFSCSGNGSKINSGSYAVTYNGNGNTSGMGQVT